MVFKPPGPGSVVRTKRARSARRVPGGRPGPIYCLITGASPHASRSNAGLADADDTDLVSCADPQRCSDAPCHLRPACVRMIFEHRSNVMDTRYSKRLLAGMFAKQAQLLHNDGRVEDAKDLFVNALALMLFAGTSPTPAPIPVRARRR